MAEGRERRWGWQKRGEEVGGGGVAEGRGGGGWQKGGKEVGVAEEREEVGGGGVAEGRGGGGWQKGGKEVGVAEGRGRRCSRLVT